MSDTPRKKKFKLRDLEIDRVDIVNRGANQHSHIVIHKSANERALLEAIVAKHAQHDQDEHGNWADGRGGRGGSGSTISDKPAWDWGAKETGEWINRVKDAKPGEGVDQLYNDYVSRAVGDDARPIDRKSFGSLPHEKQLKMAGRRPPGVKSSTWTSDAKAPEAPKTKSGHRPLSTIAREIRRDWGSKVNYAAKPYLDALGSLDDITDNYMYDSAKSVVSYFLSNASSWRGDKAREIKAELKSILKVKKSILDDPPPPRRTMPSPGLTSADLNYEAFAKNAMMGYPPQQPMDPAAMAGAQPPNPMMDRAGLIEFLRARLAAMPQTPGLPPGMVPAAPGQMPGQVPSPMGAVPQAPTMPQMPMGLPQPGSIAPGMPQPAPAPTQQPPAAPGGAPAPEGPPGAPPEKKGMPKTSGELNEQLRGLKPGGAPEDQQEPEPAEAKKKPFGEDDDEEEEDGQRPPFGQKKKTNPFA